MLVLKMVVLVRKGWIRVSGMLGMGLVFSVEMCICGFILMVFFVVVLLIFWLNCSCVWLFDLIRMSIWLG